jgi:hypothetical protein
MTLPMWYSRNWSRRPVSEDKVIFRATSLMIASKLSSGAAGVIFAGLLCVAPVDDGENVCGGACDAGLGVLGESLAAV